VRREESHAHPKRLVSLSSSLVRSFTLSPSPPMMDPTRRLVGRSQATTDAQDRVRWVHQSLGFRHAVKHKMVGQKEMDSGLAPALQTVQALTSSDY
jgi:hypothetical protein